MQSHSVLNRGMQTSPKRGTLTYLHPESIINIKLMVEIYIYET